MRSNPEQPKLDCHEAYASCNDGNDKRSLPYGAGGFDFVAKVCGR
jgi:hypothetical protein